jgi:hypothetical protein
MQSALDCGNARIEEACHIARRPLQHIAQEEDRALARWQQVQGDDKRQGDVFVR